MCAATFVWQSDDSMAQQFLPQQNESIEIIPFRQSGESAAFDSPFVQAPSQEGSNQRNFDPRSEAFGPREAYEYRRPYRGAYQGEPVGPNARRPHEGQFRQHVDASHPGGSGSRGHGGVVNVVGITDIVPTELPASDRMICDRARKDSSISGRSTCNRTKTDSTTKAPTWHLA